MGNNFFKKIKEGASCPLFPRVQAMKSATFWLSLLIPIAAVAALLLLPKETIRFADIHFGYWILIANILLIILLKLGMASKLIAWCKANRPPLSELVVITLITIGSLALALGSVEPRHRVQSDESIFLATAQNMYHNHRSATCDEGIFSVDGELDCFVDSPSFKARGQSAIWSLLMPFLGKDLRWIFSFQAVLLGITLPLLFLAVRFWTKNSILSLVTTALFAFAPMTLFQFRSTSVEPLYVTLLSCSLLALHFAISPQAKSSQEEPAWRHLLPWLFLGAVLGLFAQTRQETVFALFAFLLVALPYAIRSPRNWWALVGSVTLFALPVLFTIAHYRGYNFQGGEFDAHGHFFANIATNWKVMTAEMSGDKLVNPFLSSHTWLSLLGMITMVALAWKREEYRKWGLFILLFSLQAFMILENVSGDFTIEINQRYALVLLPTLSFFGALFLDQALRFLFPLALGVKPVEPTGRAALTFAVIATLLFSSLALRHRDSLEANIMYNRNHLTTEESEILGWVKNNPLPDKGRRLFIYNRPWHFIGYGMSAVQYNTWNRWSTEERQQKMDEFSGEVYFVRGLYCWEQKTYHAKAVESRNSAVCDQFERDYALKTEFQTTITNNYPLVLSRVLDPNPGAALSGFYAVSQVSDLALAVVGDSLLLTGNIAPIAPGHRFAATAHNGSPIDIDIPPEGLTLSIKFPKKPGLNRIVPLLLTPEGESAPLPVQKLFIADGAQLLTKQEPTRAVQSWGELKKNRSVNGNILTVRRETFAEGLGTHASSEITYDIEEKWRWFEGAVGFDDEEPGGDGMLFRILGDGRELFRSTHILPNGIQWFRVDLTGVKTLTLAVDSLGDKNFDHANWLYPTLLSR